jgi:glycosyltransferase involved in cell wall biosynthesis
MMDNPSTRLKISILTSPSGWGGTEVHTVQLARTLKSKGHEIQIIEIGSNLYGRGRFEQSEMITVTCLDTIPALRDPGLLESLRILRKLSGDVLIYPKGWFHEGSWCLDLVARLKFSRYFTIEHLASHPMPPKSSRRHFCGLVPGIGFWWYKRWYKVSIANYLRSIWSQRVVCVSDMIRKQLIDYYRFSPKKVSAVHNGIDTDKFKPCLDSRAAVRTEWGISENVLVFGSIGRLHQVKGFDVALEIFTQLVSTSLDSNVCFVLVGEGPEHESLKYLIEISGIKDKVRLVSFTNCPWELYPAFDVFIMPSRNEGLPLSLLEAMSCGCSPIAMGVGGVPEVINNAEIGWLVQPDDRIGFLNAMKAAVEIGQERLGNMGRKSRERVVMNFEARQQFMTLANLIEDSFNDRCIRS